LQAIASDLDFYDIMETRGYSRAEMNRCLSDEAKANAMADRSAADAERYGITGTPSFVLDGKLLEGTHDWPTLEKQLKDAI
jgi:predicted DsbA family dithiol-disulfide isomerase